MALKISRVFSLILMLASTAAAQEAPATLTPQGGSGDLLVAPTRIVLEGRERAGDITLTNRGSKEATYRVSLTHMRMNAAGEYENLTPEQAKASLPVADELLRYSPRQVTLAPGQSQVVKVMLRKPEGLAQGEYVSHMLFRAVPDISTGTDVEANAAPADGINIKLVPVYGVSIPIIVREGQLSVSAKIQNAVRTAQGVNVAISRSGNASIYGDVIVSQGGISNVVGQVKGVNILSYNTTRSIAVPLEGAGAGPLTVEYRARMEDGGQSFDKVNVP